MYVLYVSALMSDVCYDDWQAEDAERREKNLEEAKKIIIENDPSLPEPKTVSVKIVFYIFVVVVILSWLNVTR